MPFYVTCLPKRRVLSSTECQQWSHCVPQFIIFTKPNRKCPLHMKHRNTLAVCCLSISCSQMDRFLLNFIIKTTLRSARCSPNKHITDLSIRQQKESPGKDSVSGDFHVCKETIRHCSQVLNQENWHQIPIYLKKKKKIDLKAQYVNIGYLTDATQQ